jgi:YVTN family beta-propeller protein
VTPDSKTAYVTLAGDDKQPSEVFPIDTATATVGTAIPVGRRPFGIAITPDQAPTASFTTTPAAAGAATRFDGSASSAPVGTITSYAWILAMAPTPRR